MDNLSEPLLAEIIKRIAKTSDRNSLSLVSKQLYTIDAEQRDAIHVGRGLHPATEALASLCSRFPNLWKVVIDYSGWISIHGKQLDNQGLLVLSSHCSSLTDLTLNFCSYIDDSGIGYLAYCKKLRSFRLNFAPAISSRGLLSVAVGCKSLCTFHLVDCMKVGSVEWLEYLGRAGSLEELVVKDCKGISQYDLLKFGRGFMKLQRFEYEINGNYWSSAARDPAYVAHYPYRYDICCENMKELRLAHIVTKPEIGLRFLLGKCRALEKLWLEYVIGLTDNDVIALFQNCGNLRSLSLRLIPLLCHAIYFRTALTDDSLKALALYCPMLQVLELTFTFCSEDYPSEVGFSQEGIVNLVQSCPIRVLMLNGASNFDDEGMKGLSSSRSLETLELVDCMFIGDLGMRSIARTPNLRNLTLRKCVCVTDNGVSELVHAQNLESLTIIGCHRISLKAVQGAARSVYYSAESEKHESLKGMKMTSLSNCDWIQLAATLFQLMKPLAMRIRAF
uniref:F-box/LRR-repeat protein 15-like leucin rich repeat domain-containing protein n=2 Tax=Oryza TaxID=4527 RepID=A0A0E0NM81_ORYRU